MQRLIWSNDLQAFVPDRSGLEMIARMILGIVEGLTREEIVEREMDTFRARNPTQDHADEFCGGMT